MGLIILRILGNRHYRYHYFLKKKPRDRLKPKSNLLNIIFFRQQLLDFLDQRNEEISVISSHRANENLHQMSTNFRLGTLNHNLCRTFWDAGLVGIQYKDKIYIWFRILIHWVKRDELARSSCDSKSRCC